MEGFLYNTIGKLMGIKPSASDPEICNKCEADKTVPIEPKPAMPVEEIKTGEAEEKKENIDS